MSAPRRVIIAIDGPAGAGKSTVARRVAERLGFTYIDTGAMYRAVALWALREKIDVTDAHRMEALAQAASIDLQGGRVLLNGMDVSGKIRSPEVSAAASAAATHPGVRRALVEKQREMARSTSVVMEGRDIGSVVFPEAHVKIFLDGAPAERLRRRVTETGGDAGEVARHLEERDERDRTRAEAPLVQAADAVYVDSTPLSIEEVEEAILAIVRKRLTNGGTFA